MSKPKLIIGGRQTGKSTKSREWLLSKTDIKSRKNLQGLLLTRNHQDAKRQFTELIKHMDDKNVRWSSLDVRFGDGHCISVRPPGSTERGVHPEAVASDPISPAGLSWAPAARHSLHTIDSTEWDIEILEEHDHE